MPYLSAPPLRPTVIALAAFAAGPLAADTLLPFWEDLRQAGGTLTDRACEGTPGAHDDLLTELDRLNPVIMNNVAWLKDNCASYADIPMDEVLEWQRQAAQMGYPVAQKNYGLRLVKGDGVTADIDRGIELLRLSAAQDFGLAAAELAEIFTDGTYIAPNPVLATVYLTAARRQGIRSEQLTRAQAAQDARVSGGGGGRDGGEDAGGEVLAGWLKVFDLAVEAEASGEGD